MAKIYLAPMAIGLALIVLDRPAIGGGWAVATLDAWPAQVVANQPFTIGFSLRQHGQRLLSGQIGRVEFDNEGKPGTAPLQFEVQPTPDTGHYTATITLPNAGSWQWRIEAFGGHPMPLLSVRATPAPAGQADPIAPATLGRTLFVAKGCSACHSHVAIANSRSFGIGPPLPNGVTATYLNMWLNDPKALKPTTLMPNLGLRQEEIAALTAFLISEPE